MKYILLWMWMLMAFASAFNTDCKHSVYSPTVNILGYVVFAPVLLIGSVIAGDKQKCKWGPAP